MGVGGVVVLALLFVIIKIGSNCNFYWELVVQELGSCTGQWWWCNGPSGPAGGGHCGSSGRPILQGIYTTPEGGAKFF